MKQANFELVSAGGMLVACFVHRTDAEAVAKSFSDNGTIWYVRPSAKFVKHDPSSNWGARWTNGIRTLFDVEQANKEF